MNYYYANADNQTVGPIHEDDIHELFRAGSINLDSFIIAEGETEWKPYRALVSVATPPQLPTSAPTGEVADSNQNALCDELKSGIVKNPQQFEIILPYSIRNIVFIESLPLWLVFVFALGATAINVIRNIGGSIDRDMLVSCIIGIPITVFLLFAGWWALWRWAVRGYIVAVVFAYILYLFMICCWFLLFVFLYNPRPGIPSMAIGLLIFVFIAVLFVMFILNCFEKGLLSFVRLNGRCPSCKQWHFGHIKRPKRVECEKCGTILNFVRNKAIFPQTSPLPQYNPIPSSTVCASAAHLPVQSSTEPLAIWSLVLGIISIIGCTLVTGIPAVICGHIGRSKIKNNSALRGAGMALAGLITGYIGMMVPFVAAIAIPNIVGITQQAEVSSARRNARNLASIASAVRAAGYTNTWKTKEEAINELRRGITVDNGGNKYGPFKVEALTDEKVEAASKHLELVEHNLQYVP